MLTTKYIIQENVDCPFSKQEKQNILVRKTGVNHSRINCTVVVPPGRWSTKPGELERKQNRKYPWLVKNVIAAQDHIVPIKAITTSGSPALVWVAMDDYDLKLYKLDNNIS